MFPRLFRVVLDVFLLFSGCFVVLSGTFFGLVGLFIVRFKRWLVFHDPSGSVWLRFYCSLGFHWALSGAYCFLSLFGLGHDVWSVPGAGLVAWLHPGPT